MADAGHHIRTKLGWLERVQDDERVSASAFSVAFAISRHLNRATGEAWPGQKTLAGMAGVQVRQVRALIRQLQEAGHLSVESGGFQKPDRYRPTFTDRQSSAALRPAENCRSRAAADCRSDGAPDRQSSVAQTGTPLPPNSMSKPLEEDSPLGPPKSGNRDRRKPATELPAECPRPTDLSWAQGRAEEAFVQLDLDSEAERFRSHHLSKDSRFSDWSQAWRTWIGNSLRFAKERAATTRSAGSFSALAYAAETIR